MAYPFIVYWVLGQRQPWMSLALTLIAMLALSILVPGRRTRAVAILVVLALAAASVAFATTSALLFIPPLFVNVGLAWVFGHTLAPGQEPLVTRFARLQEDEPAAAILAYTRRLTWVWVVFFLTMAAVSATLAALGAHAAWVWFTAIGNYLCVAALFAIEYAYRRRRFPRGESVSPWRQVGMLRAALRNRH